MIDFEEALAIILEKSTMLGIQSKALRDITGDVLAEDIRAKDPIPPFDSSSVDGYALRVADVASAGIRQPVKLAVAGTIHAGEAPSATVGRGKAVKIMTGAQLPRGADAVVMKEDVTITGDDIVLSSGLHSGSNIRRKGAEFKTGETILRSGTLITPPVAGLLATAGRAHVRVFRKPRIALIITGNELRPPGEKLKPGQICDANSTALSSALRTIGVESFPVRRVVDESANVSEAIGDALRRSDIVITVGGISVGDRDFVREAMRSRRVEEHFWRIAMKPGKPNSFGTKGKKIVFGLPGNPVSALLSFQLLVRPAIARLMGRTLLEPLTLRAVLEEDLKKEAGRLEFVRVHVSNDANGGHKAFPIDRRESSMLSSLSTANGIYRFSKNETSKRKGRTITVEMLDWHW